MNRCFTLCVIAASLAAPTWAQLSEPLPVSQSNVIDPSVPGTRKFPPKALRGKLKVVLAPDILIDGKPERLSPGSRIRDTSNRLVLSASLTNQEFVVNFVRDPSGLVHEVWILTDDEIKQKIATNTPERNFMFASEADTKRQDDGKTPFNQLPSFEELGRQQRTQQRLR